jgi:hypothetical protein
MEGDAEIDAEAMTVDTSGVERLRTRLEEIATLGVEVVFWGPRPEFHPRVDVTLASSDTIGQFNLRMQKVNMDQFATLDATFARAFEGSKVRYFSSQQALCDPDCLYLRPDGGPIVVDYGHWAPEGGSYVLETMLSRYPDLAELIDGNAH